MTMTVKYKLTTFVTMPTTDVQHFHPADAALKAAFLSKFYGDAVLSALPPTEAPLWPWSKFTESEIISKSGSPNLENRVKLVDPHPHQVTMPVIMDNMTLAISKKIASVANVTGWDNTGVVGKRNDFLYFDTSIRGVGCITVTSNKTLPPSWYLSFGLDGSSIPGSAKTGIVTAFDARPDADPNTRHIWFYIKAGWEPLRVIKLLIDRLTFFHKLRKDAIFRSFSRTLILANRQSWTTQAVKMSLPNAGDPPDLGGLMGNAPGTWAVVKENLGSIADELGSLIYEQKDEEFPDTAAIMNEFVKQYAAPNADTMTWKTGGLNPFFKPVTAEDTNNGPF